MSKAHLKKKITIDYAVNRPRGLVRFPLSAHAKTGLVAIPVLFSEVEKFQPQRDAHPMNVQLRLPQYKSILRRFLRGLRRPHVAGRWVEKGGSSAPGRVIPGLKPEKIRTRMHPAQVLANQWKVTRGWIEQDIDTATRQLKGKPVVVTVKYDGELMCIWYRQRPHHVNGRPFNTVLASRGATVYVNNAITREMSRRCEELNVKEAIFFGELVGRIPGPIPFGKTSSLIASRRAQDWANLRLMVFDVKRLHDETFGADEPYVDRLKVIMKWWSHGTQIKPVQWWQGSVMAMWNQHVIEGGEEGLVVTEQRGAEYRIIKVKPRRTVDAAIIGLKKTGARWKKGKGFSALKVALIAPSLTSDVVRLARTPRLYKQRNDTVNPERPWGFWITPQGDRIAADIHSEVAIQQGKTVEEMIESGFIRVRCPNKLGELYVDGYARSIVLQWKAIYELAEDYDATTIVIDVRKNRGLSSSVNMERAKHAPQWLRRIAEMEGTRANQSRHDLRKDYDEKAPVDEGTLYRKGTVVQVWWDKQGKETWVAPDEEQAKENFKSMVERWTPELHSNPPATLAMDGGPRDVSDHALKYLYRGKSVVVTGKEYLDVFLHLSREIRGYIPAARRTFNLLDVVMVPGGGQYQIIPVPLRRRQRKRLLRTLKGQRVYLSRKLHQRWRKRVKVVSRKKGTVFGMVNNG